MKREKLDDSVKSEEKEDNEEHSLVILDEPQEDGEIASPESSPILKNTKDKGKKKKGNFLNRLKKKMWSKSNKPDNTSTDSPDIIEIDYEQGDDPDEGTVRKSKKHLESLSSQQEHHPSPPTKRARRGEFQNHQRQQSFDRQKQSPIQHQNSRRGKGDRHKNKFGIFKAFKSDNKSITFK